MWKCLTPKVQTISPVLENENSIEEIWQTERILYRTQGMEEIDWQDQFLIKMQN